MEGILYQVKPGPGQDDNLEIPLPLSALPSASKAVRTVLVTEGLGCQLFEHISYWGKTPYLLLKFCFLGVAQGFLISALLAFGTGCVFVVGTALCILRCVAIPWASID